MRPSKTLSRQFFHSLTAVSLLWLLLPPACVSPGKGPGRQTVERIRAVQVLILEGESLEDLRPHLRSWRDAGFNTVIFRAFHLAGDRYHGPAFEFPPGRSQGVFFPTNRAPVNKDLVTPIVENCREERLRPFAWMVTRRAVNSQEELPRDEIFDPENGRFLPGETLDILDAANHRYLEGLFTDLAATGVDGILLQDDLALRMTEGFTASALDRFSAETGNRTPPYRHLFTVENEGKRYVKAGTGFDAWTRWKTGNIAALAHQLENAVAKVNPGTVLIMNQMYETFIDPENARLWLSQDLDIALEAGASYVAVMLYHRQMQEELSLGLAETLELVRGALEKHGRKLDQRRVILKFQTRDWATADPVPPEDLLAALMTAWDGEWSLALIPPPTEEQMLAIRAVMRGR